MFTALLEKVASRLDRAGIPYMVIGGQAVLRHGEPRLTMDIDLTLGVDVDRLEDVLGVARGCSLDVLVDPATFVPKTMVLPCRDPESGIRVDLIFSHSAYERDAIARAETVQLGAAQVRFATVEDLIIHKMIAGRPRDLEDVRGILLRNPAAKRMQIEITLQEFGRAMDEPLVERFQEIVRSIRL